MIARAFIPILLMIVLPDVYIDARYLRHHPKVTVWRRLLMWLPCLFMVIYTVGLANLSNFVSENILWVDIYLLLLFLLVVPKVVFSLCSVVGLLFRSRKDYGGRAGVVMAVLFAFMGLYGLTLGFGQFEVRHVKICSKDLPKSFDGYRIVQFSDTHVGTYTGLRRGILENAIDSIKAQHADMIVFTGDLQNAFHAELDEFKTLFSSLKAKDGVYSVLGNHDYSMYIKASAEQKAENDRQVVLKERSFGWRLLMNESRTILRGNDSIVIAGTENDGRPPFPSCSDIHKALKGVGDDAFVIMLQHDPSAWERSILPNSKAQLTLSGHTHGGQMSLFGFRPTMPKYDEDYGIYEKNHRYINVSSGLGGVVPFRFLMPGEIVVIELTSEQVDE